MPGTPSFIAMLFSEAFGAPQETALSYLGSAGSPYQARTETFTSEFNTKNKSSKFRPRGYSRPANGPRPLPGGVVL